MTPFQLVLLTGLIVLSDGAKPANFLVLLVDDTGAADFDISGIPHDVPTISPNIRAMSSSPGAVVLPRFYIGGSVCAPTRASVLTGRTPSRDCVINVEENTLPYVLNMSTIAAVAQRAGYSTAFFGKWHLGSLSNATVPDCAPAASFPTGTCTTGYIEEAGGLCCDGRDAHVPWAPPPFFGFDVALATSQVAPSATANCGCIMTVPGAGENCELGHYAGAGHDNASQPFIECDQYLSTPGAINASSYAAVPSRSSRLGVSSAAEMSSVQFVTPVDDAAFLTDSLAAFVRGAVAAGTPWLAQVSYHQAHIPYIAPPSFRALYPNLTENEQDYYGSLSAVDAQVGRIRALLTQLGVSEDTFVVLTSDNGPELSDGDHGCSVFPNPGSTGGLVGRKRALTEGGIRVPGVIEFPRLVKANRVDSGAFPASTMDLLPTLRDLLGSPPDPAGFVVDGESLLPFLAGTVTNRTTPIGHLSDFPWMTGAPECAGAACMDCGDRVNNVPPPAFTASFATPFHQAQFAWTEGPLKLFVCNPPNDQGAWRFSLYDVVADRSETRDLWTTLGATVGNGMFLRASAWMDSVRASVANETHCTLGRPRLALRV